MSWQFVLAAIAGIIVLIALAVSALSYMRAVGDIAACIRENKPSGWKVGLLDGSWYQGNPRPLFSYWWISNLVFGIRELEISTPEYPELLRAARRRLLICFVLFMIFLIGVGWFTRGS